MTADEKRREKAKQMRMKKPIANGINLEEIQSNLWDIAEECGNVEWMTEDEEILLAALDGNEEEAYEFKIGFADLESQVEMMQNDLDNEWVPECFDIFFVAIGAGRMDGWSGWDSYEQDYYGIDITSGDYLEDDCKEKIERMTKKQLIEAAMQCFKIYQSYIALKYRYDCLKSSLDILMQQNSDLLKTVKEIEELYDKAEQDTEGFTCYWRKSEAIGRLETMLNWLPQEAWI